MTADFIASVIVGTLVGRFLWLALAYVAKRTGVADQMEISLSKGFDTISGMAKTETLFMLIWVAFAVTIGTAFVLGMISR